MIDLESSGTLRSIFDSLEKRSREILSSPCAASCGDTELREVIAKLDKCAELAASLGIFSSNESFEEIQTSHISYLLIPYYSAALSLKQKEVAREIVLKKAQIHFRQFIALLDIYDTLSEKEQGYLKNSLERKPQDVISLRKNKIERYKRRKEQVQSNNDLELYIKTRGDDCDEELRRKYLKTKILICASDAIDELIKINEEESILAFMKHNKDAQREPNEKSKTQDLTKGIDIIDLDSVNFAKLNLQKMNLKNVTFISSNNANRLRKEVFTWKLSMPTMTMDDFIEQHLRNMNGPTSGGVTPKNEDQAPDDNDNETQDEKTMRDRQWDEYKDYNPRGWGNRYNRG